MATLKGALLMRMIELALEEKCKENERARRAGQQKNADIVAARRPIKASHRRGSDGRHRGRTPTEPPNRK